MLGRTVSHYRILAQLGAGGMGVVYRAEDVRLGREVAVKFVSEESAQDEEAVRRLRSEARAASALNHGNICTIFDVGEDQGHPFIVMELMKGQTLRDRLQVGTLKVHQLVDIGIEIADALHAAHACGIIHRDIKPGNIFLTEQGHVKILDFGLAKLTRALHETTTTNDALRQTMPGMAIGTVSYMSPEQAAGEELDGRTDLFSLGVVLYECATGRHPFPGKTSAVILAAILNRTPPAPTTIKPDLPVRLQEVIANCLEKDRELRYQSAADLRADLKRLRRDIESSHSRVDAISRAGSGAPAEVGPEALPPAGRDPSSSHEPGAPASRARLFMVALAVVALLGAGAYALWPRQPAGTDTTNGAPGLSDQALESRVSLARSSLDARNYRAALAYAREVLASDSDHGEATRIRDQAEGMLRRFDEAIIQARAHLANGDVQATARSLETAREIDPSSPSIVEIGAALSELVRDRENARRESEEREAARRQRAEREPAENPTARTAPPPRDTTPREPVKETPKQAPTQPAPDPAPPTPVPVAPSFPDPPPSQPAPKAATPDPNPPAPPPPPKPAVEKPPVEKPVEKAPAGPTRADDEAAIRRLVNTYGRAIETKDLALFRSIKPNLSSDEERRLVEGFRAVSSQQVNLSVASVDLKGDTATVVLQRRDVFEVRGRRQTVESRQTLALNRSGSGWVITEIK
jgi:serine/threonine protein kinase